MNSFNTTMSRRRVLRLASAATAAASIGAFAAPQTAKTGTSDVMIAQVVDMSAAHQDVSSDFLVGSRTAWKEINSKGGLKGRKLRHITQETDGSPAGLQSALTDLLADKTCVVLSGSASHVLAQSVNQHLFTSKLAIAHTAPWMQVANQSSSDSTFSIFATRAEQVAHALNGLSIMSVKDVGAVYASAAEFDLFSGEVDRLAATLKLNIRHLRNQGTDMADLGRSLKADAPTILLFLGGTPELIRFSKGLDSQGHQRYVIAMADVNLHSVAQLGVPKYTSVIATQVVPMVTSGLPIVRAYRDALGRFYDEPPNAMSLAGYISARYTFEVLNSMDEAPNRQNTLAACQKLAQVDLGGFTVATGRGRSNAFVSQSMLSQTGKIIG